MKQMIDESEKYLVHSYNRYPVVLDHGDGVKLYDTDGKEYLDFGAGIAVCALIKEFIFLTIFIRSHYCRQRKVLQRQPDLTVYLWQTAVRKPMRAL